MFHGWLVFSQLPQREEIEISATKQFAGLKSLNILGGNLSLLSLPLRVCVCVYILLSLSPWAPCLPLCIPPPYVPLLSLSLYPCSRIITWQWRNGKKQPKWKGNDEGRLEPPLAVISPYPFGSTTSAHIKNSSSQYLYTITWVVFYDFQTYSPISMHSWKINTPAYTHHHYPLATFNQGLPGGVGM